jgi:uncharacterized membrane protein
MTFATPEVLTRLVAPWASFYSHSKPAATIVTFLHIAPIVVGGGLAIAFDRATLRVWLRDAEARAQHLEELGSVHRVVIAALVVLFASGIALLAADLDTFLGSPIFWVKMALIVALLVNGGLMTRLERTLAGPAGGREDQWRRLRVLAITSLVLWLMVTFVGVALTKAA